MELKTVILTKSPFTMDYTNVPDIDNPDNNFIREFISMIARLGANIITREIPRTFAENYTSEITLNLDNINLINSVSEFNYIILSDRVYSPDDDFDDNYFKFYFITDYKILNSTEKHTVTFSLVKDVWTSNYSKIRREGRKGLIMQSHQKWRDGNNVKNGYRACNDNVPVMTEKFYVGNPNEIDILWIRLKLDPAKSYRLKRETKGGLALPVNLSLSTPKKYGLLNYFFIPFKAFINGSPIERTDINSINELAGLDDWVECELYGSFNTTDYLISSPLILDCDFTFYPPFDVVYDGDFSNSYIIKPTTHAYIGSLYEGDSEVVRKYGVYVNGGVYDEYKRTINSNELYILQDDGTPIDTLHHYIEWSRMHDPIPRLDYSTASRYFEALPQFATYPYQYTTIRYPTRDNILPNIHFHYGFTVEIIPTDTGTRYSISYYEIGESGERIERLDKYLSSEGFEGTGSLPLTTSQFDLYIRNNGQRYDVDYQYKRSTSALGLASDLTSGILSSATSVLNVANASEKHKANAYLNVGKTVTNSAFSAISSGMAFDYIKNSRQALVNDLENTCSQTANISSNAIVDTIFQDRIMIIFNKSKYEHSYDDDIINKHYYGDKHLTLGDPLNDVNTIYDYVSAKVDLPIITNAKERNIVENILTGVTKWHVKVIDDFSKINRNWYNYKA